MTGYLHPMYADSLAEFGTPHLLPRSEGWIIKRTIPDFPGTGDAMGVYPILVCRNWSSLREDLDDLGNGLISLATVTDPFGDYSADYLRQCFPDVMIPFKQHFVADLRAGAGSVSPSHRRHVRRASGHVRAEVLENPVEHLLDWIRLYEVLIARHRIRGIAAFSGLAFRKQLQVPGIRAFRACRGNEAVGMILWYRHDDVAYYHLGAYSEEGYRLSASYALFWQAIQHLREEGVRWLSFGAGAGARALDDDGLSRFKRGWSTGTRTAYFCGRIFDRERYCDLVKSLGPITSNYFPAYRSGEFR